MKAVLVVKLLIVSSEVIVVSAKYFIEPLSPFVLIRLSFTDEEVNSKVPSVELDGAPFLP